MKISMDAASTSQCIFLKKHVTMSASARMKPIKITGVVKITLSIAQLSYPTRYSLYAPQL